MASDNKSAPDELGEVKQDRATVRRELLMKLGRLAYVPPALALLAEPKRAQAGYGNGGTKPGYGYGDPNHIHTGPPGLTSSQIYGNPTQSGPPGLSKK